MSALKRAPDIRTLKDDFQKVKTAVAGDTRFSAEAVLFIAESLTRIEALLDRLATPEKPKKKPTAWQKFFGAGMKQGKTPAEIGAEWKRRGAA